jgi:hypothetical protein
MNDILTLLIILPLIVMFIAFTGYNIYLCRRIEKLHRDIKREQQDLDNKLVCLLVLEESIPKKELKKGLYNYLFSDN